MAADLKVRKEMNRVKKELRKAGAKLECDYEYLPFNGIETVVVNSEKAEYSIYHVSAGWTTVRLRYDGMLECI